MKIVITKFVVFIIFLLPQLSYACGNNLNAMVQGPFKDSAFNNGYICFQNSPDKRDIDFYQSYSTANGEYNNKIDTFEYSDAPPEVMSVFFTSIKGKRNVVVLLRWNVNYSTNGIQYPYFYGIKIYQVHYSFGYKLFLDSDKDEQLSGFATYKNGQTFSFPLDNATKIKKYLSGKYGV